MAKNNPDLKWTQLAAAVALGMCTGLATIAYSPSAAAQTAEAKRYDLKAGTLDEALSQFGLQSGLQILAPPELVAGHRAQAVSGDLTSTQVLEHLLRGTGLSYERINANTIVIKRAAAAPVSPQAGTRSSPAVAPSAEPEEVQELEKVTVTGTRIRGAQPSSPVLMISQEEMRLAGQTNLGEVARDLPQSFSGGQNPGVATGATPGGAENQNQTGSSSFNLRGLGPDATLTLFNGLRLPYDGVFQATDVSTIPLAAVDRVEVLLDGASAIYGSDAIAGVVNVVLRRDFEGAEVSARYGVATDGGYEQQQYSIVAGHSWGSGGALVTANYTDANGVRARQRDYLTYKAGQDDYIYPSQQTGGMVFSGHQTLGENLEANIDAFYTERNDTQYARITSTFDAAQNGTSKSWGVAPSLKGKLGADWSLSVRGFYGKNNAYIDQYLYTLDGALIFTSLRCYCNTASDVQVDAEGPIFRLPGGDARLAIGAGYRRNSFVFTSVDNSVAAAPVPGHRSSRYGFAEVSMPLVSKEQNVPGVTRLVLDGAIRYEDYGSDDVGDVTTPKVGVIWGVTPDVDLRASWGRSFKAPTLLQQFQPSRIFLRTASQVGAVGAPEDSTAILLTSGIAEIKPERSEMFTAGFEIHPRAIPGLNLQVNWFQVDYTDRIVQPFLSTATALQNPAAVDFAILDPTVTQQNTAFDAAGRPVGTFDAGSAPVPYVPGNVIAIVDNRFVNASAQRAHGIDVTARYSTSFAGGDLDLTTNGSWYDSERKLTRLSNEFDVAGIIYFPPKFRGRAGASWSRSGGTVTAFINYTDGLKDTLRANRKTDEMVTLDLVADKVFREGLPSEFRVNLAVENLFNERPPLIANAQPYLVNYDSTNYSALGRVVNLTLSKKF